MTTESTTGMDLFDNDDDVDLMETTSTPRVKPRQGDDQVLSSDDQGTEYGQPPDVFADLGATSDARTDSAVAAVHCSAGNIMWPLSLRGSLA